MNREELKKKFLLEIKIKDPVYYETILTLEKILEKTKEIAKLIEIVEKNKEIFEEYYESSFPISYRNLKKITFNCLEEKIKEGINEDYLSGECAICHEKKKIYSFEEKAICFTCLKKLTKI